MGLILIGAGERRSLYLEGWRIPATQAAEVLESCRLLERAQEVEASATQRVAEALAVARARGWEAGRDAAGEEARATYAESLAILRDAVEARVGRLAVAIVRRLAADDLGGEFLAKAARVAALALLPDAPIGVRVHPSAVDAARQALADSELELTVSGDAGMPRDGCRFDSATGEVDASLSVQLAALERALDRISGDAA